MRTSLRIVGIVFVVLASAIPASAQVPSCGSISIRNDIYQEDTTNNTLYVGADLNTMRELTICPLKMRTEGWVEGTIAGAADSEGTYSSPLYIGRPVPNTGDWKSKGKHWLIWYPGIGDESWDLYDQSTDVVTVTTANADPDPEPEEPSCDETGTCEDDPGCGPYWEQCSPLIIDMGGNGFRLTSPDDGVFFDLNADGVPEKISWTAPESDDVWLAMDRNGNGLIDSGAELFGNRTPVYADTPLPTAENGFVALSFTEGPSYGRGSSDNIINARDAVFSRLLLWRDTNHNGISEGDELTPASQSAVLSIDTKFKESRRRDAFGNEFRQRAQAELLINGTFRRHYVYDVWLQRAR